MADVNPADYYRSRERRERELADAAQSPAIAKIHRDMAAHYSSLIAETAPDLQADMRRATA